MFRTEDVFYEAAPDGADHASVFVDGGSELCGDRGGHALEVDGAAVGHVGHGGWGVDVRAVCGDGVDGGEHDLLSRVRILYLDWEV